MSVVSDAIEPLTFVFADDGLVPNNPMPFLVYKARVDVANAHPEKTIEGLFGANGWGGMWRNGVYDFLHYHATVHEALGVARGHARVRFGGDQGREFDIAAGDVAILPAGTGHQCISASRGFLRGRRLSAGAADGSGAADAGNPREGAEDDSAGEAAEDRSGARGGRAAGAVVEEVIVGGQTNVTSFSPCGRRWSGRMSGPDEGFLSLSESCREERTPHPSRTRFARPCHPLPQG